MVLPEGVDCTMYFIKRLKRESTYTRYLLERESSELILGRACIQRGPRSTLRPRIVYMRRVIDINQSRRSGSYL